MRLRREDPLKEVTQGLLFFQYLTCPKRVFKGAVLQLQTFKQHFLIYSVVWISDLHFFIDVSDAKKAACGIHI